MFYIPILTAFVLAISTIIEKTILKKRKISVSLYQTASFLAVVLAMLPFIYFFWRIDAGAFEIKNIFILCLIVIFSVIANLLALYALKWEKVTKTEPARIFEPLFVIILAIIFSFVIDSVIYERNPNIIIPAIIAGCALVFSTLKKHHLEFNKYIIAAIVGSFFFALELVISILILEFYSPLAFYFTRCIFIFVVCFVILKPNFKELDTKIRKEILLVAFLWVIYRVTLYYGYQKLGIISTTLIVMLAPVFLYLLAYKFLKEKPTWRNIIASIIIIGCVVYAVLV